MALHNLTDEKALTFARRHLTAYYDTDFFPRPFELVAIWHKWDEAVRLLSNPGWQPFGHPVSIPWKKPRGGYRIVHQLDPIDAVVYTASVYAVSKEIERARQPKYKQIACSYRIDPDDHGFFVAGSGFSEYRSRCEELAGKHKYVLTTDISDFYNRVYLHRIQNAIESCRDGNAGKDIENLLLTFNNKTSQGIPVGPAASIVLSEAVLIDVDQYLERSGKRHVRYVDDIRIFGDSPHELDVLLQGLTMYLHKTHRLGLVADKTKITTSESFLKEELANQYQIEKLEILSSIEVLNPYADSNPDDEAEPDDENSIADLAEKLHKSVDRIAKHETLDLAVARAIIRRARSHRIFDLVEHVLPKIEFFRPVINDVFLYLNAVTEGNERSIAIQLEGLPLGELMQDASTRIWLSWYLSQHKYFANNRKFDEVLERFGEFRFRAISSHTCRNVAWVRQYKDQLLNLGPWDRRGVIFASTVLPRDERMNWLEPLKKNPALTPLDRWLIEWVLVGAPAVPPLPKTAATEIDKSEFDDDIPW